uniref:TIL domain-containing protein n=1 Tax=Parastrongyloides trichosuri TaxID=131310 RepID=A0A0N4Z8H1_PARTI
MIFILFYVLFPLAATDDVPMTMNFHKSGKKYPKNAEEAKCSKNATYVPNCRSPCPEVCGDIIFQACSLTCDPPGCECNMGYALRRDGRCVLKKECPKKECPKNMEYKTKCPPACALTCANKNFAKCHKKCGKEKGCYCKKGFVLCPKSGRCIKPKDCPREPLLPFKPSKTEKPTTTKPTTTKPSRTEKPKKCPPNMEWSRCKSTCKHYCGDNVKVCTDQCAGSGCECPLPFVLNRKGECIKESECPKHTLSKKCPYGQVYEKCPPRENITCKNYKTIKKYQKCGKPRCVCKSGMALYKGQCFKTKYCKRLRKMEKSNSLVY